MVCEQSSDLKKVQVLKRGEIADVYLLDDGRIFKQFHQIALAYYKARGLCLEQKILETDKIKRTPEINLPLTAVYDRKYFDGYTCKKEAGVVYSTFATNLNKEQLVDLNMYAYIYNKLETAVVKGWHRDLCFPDLIGQNYLIDKDWNVCLIDFDGMQYGGFLSPSISEALIDTNIECSKYRNGMLWTKELDKKSLMYIYFSMAFKASLKVVGRALSTGTVITLDDVFEMIGLEEPEIYDKVKCTISSNEKGTLLGEDVWYIAQNYDLKIIEDKEVEGGFVKKLVRKN